MNTARFFRNGKVSEIRLGDRIERLVKPIAKAIKSPCLDKDNQLKPDSRCRKIRDKLNKIA